MGEVTVSIKHESIIGINLYIDDVHYHHFIAFEQRVQAWENALKKLDADVTSIALNVRDIPEGYYFWSYTYINHRNDGVLGTIHHYYLIEIMEILRGSYLINRVDVQKVIPLPLYKYLCRNYKTHVTGYKYIDIYLKHFINSCLKPFFKLLKIVVPTGFQVNGEFNNVDVLVCSSSKLRLSNRYDFVRHILRRYKIVLYPRLMNKNLKVPGFQTIKFSQFLRELRFFNLMKKSIGLWRYSRNLNVGSSLFEENVKRQTLIQFLLLNCKLRLLTAAFKHLKPERIFYSGAIADPEQKLNLMAADKAGIETVVVSCRPTFSTFRSEDRIIEPELKTKGNLPDLFYVKDSYSKNTLVSFGYSEEKIRVIRSKGLDKSEDNRHYDNALIILFTQYEINSTLLELLSEFEYLPFDKLLIRSHPSRRSIHAIDNVQEALIDRIHLPVEEITDYRWDQLTFDNCVAIGVNTTSLIETASKKCGIIWLPFISDLSLQYFPVYRDMGQMLFSQTDFTGFMNKLHNRSIKRNLILKSNKAYGEISQ